MPAHAYLRIRVYGRLIEDRCALWPRALWQAANQEWALSVHNVAIRRWVSASSYQDKGSRRFLPRNLVDGDLSTRWCLLQLEP